MRGEQFDLKFVLDRLLPIVVGVVCLVGIPATTAAVNGELVDTLGPEDTIVLEPADGPNGEYAEISPGRDRLRVNITEDGVNNDAVTDVENVFTITNRAAYPQHIWINHTAPQAALSIYHTDAGQQLTRDAEIVVTPNETIGVNLQIDTTTDNVQPTEVLQFTILISAVARGDADDDGIPNNADQCPNQAEDADGVQDGDGCPETDADDDGLRDEIDPAPTTPDLDSDGVRDGTDSCLRTPEDQDGVEDSDGCPEEDADDDGIPDEEDACPLEAEDHDGVQDQDGCPETDADSDGVRDPFDPEPTNPDRDGDGVLDGSDACPNQPGDNQGCPVSEPSDSGAPAETQTTPTASNNTTTTTDTGLTGTDTDTVANGVAIDFNETDTTATNTTATVTDIGVPTRADADTIQAVISQTGTSTANQSQGAGGTSDLNSQVEVNITGGISDNFSDAPEITNASTRDRIRQRVSTTEANTLTLTDQETPLVGSHSLYQSRTNLPNDQRMIRQVDISVPPAREDQPATVHMAVQRSQLGTNTPATAKIGHRSESGWELLETEIVEINDETVVLQAQTPGFSRFGVFIKNNVTYRWTVESYDEPLVGRQIDPVFQAPGLYNATLTVRDEFGRTDTTNTTILANDRPQLEIETRDIDQANQTATVHAAVTDEFGRTRVVWVLPNGTTRRTQTVTYTFGNRSQNITAYAIDEYGAVDRATMTVAADNQLISFEAGIPFGVRYILAAWFGGLVLILYRWQLFGLIGGLLTNHGPEIVSLSEPTVDVQQREVRLDHLVVEDEFGDLVEIEIEVLTDRGEEILSKTIDFPLTDRYEESDQRIWYTPDIEIDEEKTHILRIQATDKTGVSATQQQPMSLSETP